jgi:hypothetical protein
MISFVRAHGYDPGPTQRPLLAGAITGLLATVPGGLAFVGFGSFHVVVDDVFRLSRVWTAALMLAAFILAGLLYGAVFQRAANDRRAGWLIGLAYGFILWFAAPVVALPLIQRTAMAGGSAAVGFLVSFLIWGLAAGVLFPYVHRPLHANLEAVKGGSSQRLSAAPGVLAAPQPHRILAHR